MGTETKRFRMWNGERMKHDDFLLNAAGELRLSGEGELMQYTGRTDCEGTPVFEGDIVETEHGASGLVEWSDKRWGWSFTCDEPLWPHPFEGMGGEKTVVGNKFENPELLEN